MTLSHLSIKLRTLILAGCCLLAVVAVLVGSSIQRTQDLADQVRTYQPNTECLG
ncbi:hypothetical protein D3C84_1091260 [compost metagenome]